MKYSLFLYETINSSIFSGDNSAKNPKCPVFMATIGIETKSNLCTVFKKDPSPPIDIISSVFSSIFSLISNPALFSFSTSIFFVYIDFSKLLYAIVMTPFILLPLYFLMFLSIIFLYIK